MNQPTMLELSDVITELLAAGQPVHFTATGESMLPLISSGATLHVIPNPVRNNSTNCVGAGLKPARNGHRPTSIGEIVLVKSAAGGVLAHRLVNNKSLQTRGDNSQHLDPAGEIVGRVTGVEQNGRYLNLNHPLWQTFNLAIGHASTLQLRIGASYQASPNLLKLLGRKAATAIFRGLLGLACLAFRNPA